MVKIHSQLSVHTTPLASRHHRSSLTMLQQYWEITQVFLADYRNSWFFQLLYGILLPIGFIFFLKLSIGTIDPKRAVYLLGGDLTTSIACGPTMMLIVRLGWGRYDKEFDYWATLPIAKLTLIFAMISVYLLFALPGVLGSYVFGCLMLNFPLTRGLALIPLIPLGAISLTSFGAFIGVYAKDGITATILGNAFMSVVTFLTPTLLPYDSIPLPLRILSWCIPTTYIADAFRAMLTGNIGVNFIYDIIILTGLSIVCLAIVHWKLDWREA